MFDQKKMVLGAVGGFLGAVLVDLHAYSAAPTGEGFNWGKAVPRWIAGGISGGLVGLGLPAMGIV